MVWSYHGTSETGFNDSIELDWHTLFPRKKFFNQNVSAELAVATKRL